VANREILVKFSAETRYPSFSLSLPAALGLCQLAIQWVLADVFEGRKGLENEVDHAHLVPSVRGELQKHRNRTTGRLAHAIAAMPTTLSRLLYMSVVL
jgi:hypothetical protein